MREQLLFNVTVSPAPLAQARERNYEALLCTLGYESRSSEVAKHLAGTGVDIHALGFPHAHDAVYDANHQFLKDIGAKVTHIHDEAATAWVWQWLGGVVKSTAKRCAIDISSMSRPRIAAAVRAIRAVDLRGSVIDLIYVPERYLPAPEEPTVMRAVEPISREFAGWAVDARQSLAVVFGLGYEPARAAGALDYLEPAVAVPFFPIGRDKRFIRDVERANREVLAITNVKGHRQDYAIEDPSRCIAALEAVAHELQRSSYRPLLLPFGPKVFALCCLFVASAARPELAVWRVSGGEFQGPVDRIAADLLVTLRVSQEPLESQDPW